MKQWSIVPVAVVLSVVASVVTMKLFESPAVAGAEQNDLSATSLERLSLTLAALEERQQATESAIEDLRLGASSAANGSSRVAVGELEAAVARYLEEHGLGADSSALAALETDAAPDGVADADLDDLMDWLLGGDLTALEEQNLWQRLREEGRLDEIIAEFERRAELDPNNPDLQVDLGGAYLQKIFDVGNGPLAGVYGVKADEAFDRALALDETHWEARLTKAIALSNWPAFMGKSGEAIKNFEVLIEQQKNGPSKPEHAQTYYFLGNMYLQTGDTAKALQIWRDGLGMFPDNQRLLEQIDMADD